MPDNIMPEKKITMKNGSTIIFDGESKELLQSAKIVPIEQTAEYQPPSYSTVGRILVRYDASREETERFEVLDFDAESSVFWIQEGVGFDYWLENVEFPCDGIFVIEGISGTYFRGDGYITDDDEEWDYGTVRPAIKEETETEALA